MSRRKKTKIPDAPAQARSDGFVNRRTGLGTRADPTTHVRFCHDPLSDQDARELYRGNDVAKKIVEYKPRAAFREGYEIKTNDENLTKKITDALEALGVTAAMREAIYQERARGGAAIYPVINDGQDLAAELATEGRMLRIENLQVLEARELRPVSYYRSLFDPKFGQPMRYRFMPIVRGGAKEVGQLIHESRLIIFPGVRVSRDQVSANIGWGDGVLDRVHRVLAKYEMTWDGIAVLMQRLEQGVLKMKGFTNAMARDQDGSTVGALMDLDRLRNLLDMMVIDGEDEYQRLAATLTGVPDTLKEFLHRLAGAAEMPASFLAGALPGGLHSTGDSETRAWYDDVAAEQEDHYGPRLRAVVKLYLLTNESVTGGKIPDGYSLKFRPLWQPTEKETADTNASQAQADKVYLDAQVLTRAQVARNRFGGDGTSLSTTLTSKEIQELEKLEQAPTPEEIAALAGKPAFGAPGIPGAPVDPNAPPQKPGAVKTDEDDED